MRIVTKSALPAMLVSLALAVTADAQVPQVVQLPSFRTFSYSGSVLVPTQGTAALGSNVRSSTGRVRGRGFGRAAAAGNAAAGASANVQIIDLQSIDQRLLGGTLREYAERNQAQAQPQVKATEEGKKMVRYARSAYRQGRKSVAFEAYRIAIEKLDGRLQQLAETEFRRMFGESAEQAIRMAELSK